MWDRIKGIGLAIGLLIGILAVIMAAMALATIIVPLFIIAVVCMAAYFWYVNK